MFWNGSSFETMALASPACFLGLAPGTLRVRHHGKLWAKPGKRRKMKGWRTPSLSWKALYMLIEPSMHITCKPPWRQQICITQRWKQCRSCLRARRPIIRICYGFVMDLYGLCMVFVMNFVWIVLDFVKLWGLRMVNVNVMDCVWFCVDLYGLRMELLGICYGLCMDFVYLLPIA